jgi:hypothetical protein
MVGPALAPLLETLGLVPVADFPAEPVLVDLAHRQHDVRVRLGHAVFVDVPVHVEVGDHALVDKLALHDRRSARIS